MSIVTEHLEREIIFQRFSEKLTLSSLAEGQEVAMQILATAEEKRIVAILDVSEATVSPYDLNINSARSLRNIDKDKTIGFVIIGASQSTKMLVNMFKRVLGIKMIYANDVDSATLEARKILDAYKN